jgi:hypothetical protein
MIQLESQWTDFDEIFYGRNATGGCTTLALSTFDNGAALAQAV